MISKKSYHHTNSSAIREVTMEGATEQAAEVIMCATAVPISWPQAFVYVGYVFAVAFIVYCICKHL